MPDRVFVPVVTSSYYVMDVSKSSCHHLTLEKPGLELELELFGILEGDDKLIMDYIRYPVCDRVVICRARAAVS